MVQESGAAIEAAASSGAVQQSSLLQEMWGQLKNGDFKGIGHSLQSASINWLEIGTWLGLGFAVGFFSKRYLQQVIFLSILCVIVLCALDYFSLVSIQWESLKQLLNIKAVQQNGVQPLLGHAMEWLRLNAGMVITASIGFIVGWIAG